MSILNLCDVGKFEIIVEKNISIRMPSIKDRC
jgi:hypothetical protein